jgi:hypothetical protein
MITNPFATELAAEHRREMLATAERHRLALHTRKPCDRDRRRRIDLFARLRPTAIARVGC